MASLVVCKHILALMLEWGSGIVLLEKKIVSNSPRDWLDLVVKDFIHVELACKCAPNYNP